MNMSWEPLIAYALLATSTIGLLLVFVKSFTRPNSFTSAFIPLSFVPSWFVCLMPLSFFRIPDLWLLSTLFVVQIAAFVGLIKTWNSKKEQPKTNRAAWSAPLFVAWGAWNALTDGCPFNETQARPSWYVYGWPLCIGTSGRGRFNIADFEATALVVDLVVSALLITCTYLCLARLTSSYPQFSLRQWFSFVAGLFFAFVISSGAHYGVLNFFSGAALPNPRVSAHGGNIMPLAQTSLLAIPPLFVGWFSVGSLIFDGLSKAARLLLRRRTTR